MESQNTPSLDETQAHNDQSVNEVRSWSAPSSSTNSAFYPGMMILRSIAIALTLIASIAMAVARKTVNSGFVDEFTIKSTQFAAYVYFLVANVVVFCYSIISLLLTLMKKESLLSILLWLGILDLFALVFLLTSNGASIAIIFVSEQGQNRQNWVKFCDIVSNFCARINSAISMSMLATFAYLLILIFCLFGLRRK